jgi:hypothetical protein
MTPRIVALCSLTALALTISANTLTLVITDSINHQLALMACRRTPDTLCARS